MMVAPRAVWAEAVREARQAERPEAQQEALQAERPVGWLEASPGAWQVELQAERQAERREGLEEGHLGARWCRVRARGKCATR